MNTDIYCHNNITAKLCHDNVLELLKTQIMTKARF